MSRRVARPAGSGRSVLGGVGRRAPGASSLACARADLRAVVSVRYRSSLRVLARTHMRVTPRAAVWSPHGLRTAYGLEPPRHTPGGCLEPSVMVWSPHGPLACGGASGDRPSAQRERERAAGVGLRRLPLVAGPDVPGGSEARTRAREGESTQIRRGTRRRGDAPLATDRRAAGPRHAPGSRASRPAVSGALLTPPPPPSPIAVSGISEPSVCIEGTASI